MKNWHVVEYNNGKFVAIVSGLGRNKGTWDSNHTKRTAKKWAEKLTTTEKLARHTVFVAEQA
jgi:hypothetical protein